MQALVLELYGGPLDGVYLPITPKADTPPSIVFIYYPELRVWSMYEAEQGGGTAQLDVYRIVRGGALHLAHPPNAQLWRMLYVRPLNPKEVAEIEKMGPPIPPEFK